MFRFIHTYTEASFPGLTVSGLWRSGDGLKLMHKPGFWPPCDFNTAAAVDSSLERLLRELNGPFYIDRLQGGLGLTRHYPYDPALLDHYQNRLGERFWGFQMHEWASNFRSDLERIEALMKQNAIDSNDAAQTAQFWHKVKSGALSLFLEAHTDEEYAQMALPADLPSFLQECRALYAKRTRETDGLLLPADSYFMAPRIEIANGAGRLMPEMGWQIPGMRLQIAYTRGMAKAAQIAWGMYYECWQLTDGKELSIPFSLREGQDEWREDLLHKGYGCRLPFDRREHGGSSLSLLARAWRCAYFSGADAIAEEYGVCNTFRELDTFALSPYGEAKKDFLRFTEQFPDLGAPFTPIAVVLPADLPILDLYADDRYLHYPVSDHACPPVMKKPDRFRESLDAVFGRSGRHGNMGHVLRTGGLPGVVDVLHADMTEALSQYDWLIDLTDSETFRKQHRNTVTPEQADRVLDRLLPCRFDKRLFAAYNKCGDGWFVLVMNNDGVFHDGFRPDVILPEAAVYTAVHCASDNLTITRLAGSGTLCTNGSAANVLLKGGEWLLLKIN